MVNTIPEVELFEVENSYKPKLCLSYFSASIAITPPACEKYYPLIFCGIYVTPTINNEPFKSLKWK